LRIFRCRAKRPLKIKLNCSFEFPLSSIGAIRRYAIWLPRKLNCS
jgi:hypothetical protein